MKKIITVVLIMFGVMFTASAQSPVLELGKAVGELVILPFGIVAGACEGIYDGVNYLFTGEATTTSTTTTRTVYTQSTSAPVYVVPPQNKTPKNEVNIVNSPGASVTVNEVNSSTSTTRTPTVIYVPSTRPNYYYYNPFYYSYP